MAGVTNTEMCDVRQREAHCVRNQFSVIREVSGGYWATQASSQATGFLVPLDWIGYIYLVVLLGALGLGLYKSGIWTQGCLSKIL